jgi:hypothetical protein
LCWDDKALVKSVDMQHDGLTGIAHGAPTWEDVNVKQSAGALGFPQTWAQSMRLLSLGHC